MLELKDVSTPITATAVLPRHLAVASRTAKWSVCCAATGAGKTTTLLTIMGYVRCRDGTIGYKGKRLDGLHPYLIARRGIGFVPQERRIFPSLTVRENLTVGERRSGRGRWTLNDIFDISPTSARVETPRMRICRAANSRCWPLPGR